MLRYNDIIHKGALQIFAALLLRIYRKKLKQKEPARAEGVDCACWFCRQKMSDVNIFDGQFPLACNN